MPFRYPDECGWELLLSVFLSFFFFFLQLLFITTFPLQSSSTLLVLHSYVAILTPHTEAIADWHRPGKKGHVLRIAVMPY